jgi:hypothetical protein
MKKTKTDTESALNVQCTSNVRPIALTLIGREKSVTNKHFKYLTSNASNVNGIATRETVSVACHTENKNLETRFFTNQYRHLHTRTLGKMQISLDVLDARHLTNCILTI